MSVMAMVTMLLDNNANIRSSVRFMLGVTTNKVNVTTNILINNVGCVATFDVSNC